MQQETKEKHTNKSQPILKRILIPMILLILIETILLGSGVMGSRVLERIQKNEKEIMAERVINRKNYIQNQMVNSWSNVSLLVTEVNNTTRRLLEEQKLELPSIDDNSELAAPLLSEIQENMITCLRSDHITGCFLILNTDGLQKEKRGKKTGIYLRDSDPTGAVPEHNTDLILEYAPVSVVKNSNITTSKIWSTMYDYSEKDYEDFWYQSYADAITTRLQPENYQQARYWSTPHILHDGKTEVISFSVPLILEDGTVYGVLGTEVSLDYLETMLPDNEVAESDNSSYLLGVDTNDDLNFLKIFIDGKGLAEAFREDETISLTNKEEEYAVKGSDYYADIEYLDLYDSNTSFYGQKWALIGIIPREKLVAFSTDLMNRLIAALFVSLVLCVLVCILVAIRIARPITNLATEISEKDRRDKIRLARTGVRELDQLEGTIEQLSEDVAVTERQKRSEIEYERDHDLLTGLINRRAFQRIMREIFTDGEKNLKIAALVMMDLDNLKYINDTFGHDSGDQYIKQAADMFVRYVPNGSVVARISGDEFYLFLYGYESQAQIRQILKRLTIAMRDELIELPTLETRQVGASGGIAWYPQDGTEFEKLLRYSDFAMYQTKQHRKGELHDFDIGVYNQEMFHQQNVAELTELLNSTKVDYYFQPIVDAKTGKVFAHEALMRPKLATLRSPYEVLELAKKEGKLQRIEYMT